MEIFFRILKITVLLFSFSESLFSCRLWGIISSSNNTLQNSYDPAYLVQSESDYFEELGSNYLSWSLSYYNQTNQLADVYRSDLPTNADTMYQHVFSQALIPGNGAKIILGHLRSPTSGAIDIENPHPFLFEHDNKTYSLMHNGTLSKTILVRLLTEGYTDSTWINANPPNTFNDSEWHSDEGWPNVIDSELLMLWIMKNIQLGTGDELEKLMYSIQKLETLQPGADKNFIFTDGQVVYAYGSQVDGFPDLHYSDQTPFEYGDSTITPHFISIMSEIPSEGSASVMNWIPFNNESLLIIDSNGDLSLIENFINHAPTFSSSQLVDTIGVSNNYNYELYASDVDGEDTLEFYIENNPGWAEINDRELVLMPEESGIFYFNIVVSDGSLNDVLECAITVGEYRPSIVSILDVPNDDGSWVYIEFLKSFWDNDENRNTEIYHIERLTSGEWISVGSSAAYNSESYTVQVSTGQDYSPHENNAMVIFRVIASMNEGVWISLPDSGYSINNSLDILKNIEQPSTFSLSQNYPNPFNATTLIKYDLPLKSKVSIVIYDILGKEVKNLVHEVQEPGFKKVLWDGKNLFGSPVASGIYLVHMKSANFDKTRNIVLSK